MTDANGKTTDMEYDALNNPVKVISADGSVISTEYTKWNTAKNTSRYDGSQPFSVVQTFDDRGLAISHRQTWIAGFFL